MGRVPLRNAPVTMAVYTDEDAGAQAQAVAALPDITGREVGTTVEASDGVKAHTHAQDAAPGSAENRAKDSVHWA